MKRIYLVNFTFIFICLSPLGKNCNAQNDTLHVMVQNVLHFGDGCQGTLDFLNSQLEKEVHYTNADLIGLDKMQAIKLNNSDPYGISPTWFADSIIYGALDVAFPGRFAYCTLTDYSQATDNDMSVLFYNKNKLGFLTVKPLYEGEEDIDVYKLFYKDPNLNTNHDTTFLYVVLCHTISGSSSSGRDAQATTVIDSLQKMFTHLPNLIYMGDFNTHNSTEPGYELITQTIDTSFLFYDPPFKPDNKLTYQIDWTTNPSQAAAELTTTTRSTSNPNSCGNSGGAYSWFDHIFLSRPVINNYDYIHYIPNSWKSLGNDGKRVGIDINDSVTNGKNTSAPSSVINAEWQFSDKYPVTVELGVTYNTSTGTGSNKQVNEGGIKVNNPIHDAMTIYFTSSMIGEKATMELYDVCGRLVNASNFMVNTYQMTKNVNLAPGVYLLKIQVGEHLSTNKIIVE
jgi:hypothetical protein